MPYLLHATGTSSGTSTPTRFLLGLVPLHLDLEIEQLILQYQQLATVARMSVDLEVNGQRWTLFPGIVLPSRGLATFQPRGLVIPRGSEVAALCSSVGAASAAVIQLWGRLCNRRGGLAA